MENLGPPAHGRLTAILLCAKKGEQPTPPLQHATLRQGLGLEGDRHAKGGQRQLSLFTQGGRTWMAAQSQPGLCFPRFRENLCFDGLAMGGLEVGARLSVGEALIEITAKKGCYADCPLFSQGLECRLAREGLFAKVTGSGEIRVGDLVERMLSINSCQ